MLSNLSLSNCNCSSVFNFSRSSILFFSITRSFVFKSSNSLAPAALLAADRWGAPEREGRTVRVCPSGLLGWIGGVPRELAPSELSSTPFPAGVWTGDSVLRSLTPLSGPSDPIRFVGLRESRFETGLEDKEGVCPRGFAALLAGPTIDWRDVLEAADGAGGGAMDVRLFRPVLGFAAAGALVEDVDAVRPGRTLVDAEASCFVGDFVGDYNSEVRKIHIEFRDRYPAHP